MTKARAALFHEVGDSEVLRLEQVDVPEPGPGEIRLRISAFGLNRSEAMFRQGWHPVKPQLPSRIGYEAAGIVESVGQGVTEFAVGDHVGTLPIMELNPYGAWGELMIVPVHWATLTPPGLDALESASLWSSYMTAYAGLVDLVSIKVGNYVLVTAASSSVGPPAIQILKMLGARVIATTRGRTKGEAIRAMGADHVIVTDEEDLVRRVNEITGNAGVQFVFDPIGGPAIEQLTKITAPYGTIILYGVLSFDPAPLPLGDVVSKNLNLLGFAMMLEDRPERNARAIQFIRDGVKTGKLRPLIAKSFTLDEVVNASRYLDSMQQIGKVVVQVDHA